MFDSLQNVIVSPRESVQLSNFGVVQPAVLSLKHPAPAPYRHILGPSRTSPAS
jgi:hypothetical protein